MIAHLVLFKFRPGVTRADARVAAVVEQMDGLPRQIPAIRGWEHGHNVTADAEAWDYGLRALFESEADLHAYFDHPAHAPVVASWQALAELRFCDFPLQ